MKRVFRLIFAAVILALITATPVLAVDPANSTILKVSVVSPGASTPSPAPAASPSPGALITTNADGTKTCKLTEPGITVSVPGDLYIFTRHMAADDPNPSVFGLSRQDYINFFEKENIYLNAVASKVIYEINLTMVSTPEVQKINDFNLLSETELQDFAQKSKALYQIPDCQYDAPTVHAGNQSGKFIKSSFSGSNGAAGKTFGVQFYTIHDGKAINIILNAYSTAKVSELMPMMTKIVDTATFAKDTVAAPTPSAGAQASASPQTSAGAQASAGPQTSAGAQASAGPQTSPVSLLDAGAQMGAGVLSFLGKQDYLLYAALLLATFLLVTLPVIIYRHAVRKSPLELHSAALVAGVYGLVWVVLGILYVIFFKGSVFAEAGVVLWSIVNYFVLMRAGAPVKKETDIQKGLYPLILAEETEKRQTPAANTNMTVNKTCKNCFAVNLATSKVCFYCGAQLDDDLEESKELFKA